LVLFYLNAQTGAPKGRTWPLGPEIVVVGRSADCQIAIDDSLVSRKHCEIVSTDGGLLVRDLGSGNATLVNGRPVTESPLRPGDELAIGRTVLLVTISAEATVSPLVTRAPSEPTTVQLAGEQSAMLGDKTAALIAMAYPNSVEDLAALYDIGRKCSRVLTVSELMKTIFEELRTRFMPSAAWIARLRPGASELFFYTRASCTTGEIVEPPLDVERKAQKAMLKPGGLVVPIFNKDFDERRMATLLIAPMGLGEQRIGALLVRCEASKHQYGEHDLRLLVSIANTVAPYFRATEHVELLRRDNQRLRALTRASKTLIGSSRAIRQVRSLISNAAPSELPILIQGETGTGKELAAIMVHESSARSNGPLVTVNCAAIPAQLLESELFGYEKGAFTSAEDRKAGRLEEADGGTLFLDEIGDLSLENQAKILRVIESGTFTRLGGNREMHVSIRVVTASNKRLDDLVKQNLFRADLYHRLNGLEVLMPPLRDRPSDIPILAEYFLKTSLDRAKRPIVGFSEEAVEYLRSRRWPGNVRELRNFVERAVALARSEHIDIAVLETCALSGGRDIDVPMVSLAEVEKQHIVNVLQQCGGNIRDTAKILGIGRSTLYNKIAEYDISV
jgi:Nif-specific regulatory protein